MKSARTRHAPSVIALLALCLPALADAGTTWPSLRGPAHDGTVRDEALFEGEIADLEVAWRAEIGSGYPVVTVGATGLVTAYQADGVDVVAAFDPESGRELWRYEIGPAYAGHPGSHDGPIATPARDGHGIYVLGPYGQLVALDGHTGEPIWTRHLVDELGVEPPFYGFGASPLVAGDVLVVQMGGPDGKSIGGFSAVTGELLWSTGDDPVEYNSPILATLGGRQQVVAAGMTLLRGIDPGTGEVLWTHEHGGDERAMGGATTIPTPAGENRILLLNKHPESTLLEITHGADGWTIDEEWTTTAIKGTYVQPVYHDGYLYGMNGKIFTCIDAATGEMVWRSREPGDGFPTLVGDHLVIMTKPGVLRVAEASPEGYRELASIELFDSVSWSQPAVVDGSIYVRSMRGMARVEPVAIATASKPAADLAEEAPTAARTPDPTAPTVSGLASFLEQLSVVPEAERSARVDELLAPYVAGEATMPIVEDAGLVHFLYRGEAGDVGIVGDHVGFRREDPMTRIEGTDLFHYSTRLEPDAAITYGFLVDYGEPAADPLNPRTGAGLFGEVSFLAMPGYRAPDLEREAPESKQGRLEELSWESAAFEDKTRTAQVYLPAGYDPEGGQRYPVAYVVHGGSALEQGLAKNALDHAIAQSSAPLIAVFVMPDEEAGQGELRTPAYAEMIVDELVPLIDERYATRDDRLARGAIGAAGAGDAAFRLAFTRPEAIGLVGALWPTLFAFDAEPPLAAEHPLVVYQRWGTYHLRSPHENFDSRVANVEFLERLRQLGHRPAGGEVAEGFGWTIWRSHIDDMLAVLFPPVPGPERAVPSLSSF
jgi:enterochelin esterase-like enzyme/outer membrane protein assembly factor BamB